MTKTNETADRPGQEYEAEARQRWGSTDAYKESARRTKGYTKDDWAAIKAENEQIEADFASVMAAGHAAESDEATAVAERARQHIDRWFYPCSTAMHSGIAEMYTVDARFKENYEKRAEGLAEFVSAAIRANQARGGPA